jgi:hypothetical protein
MPGRGEAAHESADWLSFLGRMGGRQEKDSPANSLPDMRLLGYLGEEGGQIMLTTEERKVAAQRAREWPKGEPKRNWYVGQPLYGNPFHALCGNVLG